ncbi:DUF1206 domain-containing protein [Microbacterium pumilum]|uniref:DUF1206 domain-containing protein n=1 Tax=Microbacterium pumilum TaxID=344165 RepID=A0ABP5DTR1_9MICO
MSADVKHAARKAESSHSFRVVARAGFAANGLVHVLIGVIVLGVTFGGHGETDQAGVFKAVAAVPAGFLALWILAVALLALGIYHALEGILARGGDAAKKWGRRIGEWGQAVVFIALGVIAAAVALGAKPDADQSAEEASRGILSIPGGPFVLGLIGIGIGIGGVSFIAMGFMRSFEKKMAIPSGPAGTGIKGLGVVGFIAKGIALIIIGILLTVAAVKVEPSAAGGLDAAIDALLALTLGPVLVGAVGVGLIAYGVFCFFRAPYARL